MYKYTAFKNKSNPKMTIIAHFTTKDKNTTKKYINGYIAAMYMDAYIYSETKVRYQKYIRSNNPNHLP